MRYANKIMTQSQQTKTIKFENINNQSQWKKCENIKILKCENKNRSQQNQNLNAKTILTKKNVIKPNTFF